MLLPHRLHVNPLSVVQCHGCDKILRQGLVILYLKLLHIVFHDLCVHLVIHIRPVQGFCLPLIVIGIDRLNAAGNTQHGGQGSRRRNGQKL